MYLCTLPRPPPPTTVDSSEVEVSVNKKAGVPGIPSRCRLVHRNSAVRRRLPVVPTNKNPNNDGRHTRRMDAPANDYGSSSGHGCGRGGGVVDGVRE